jgi:hypothetical protein
MRPWIVAAALCLALAGCGGSTPFAIVMPSGSVLKGSASTRLYRGSFFATDGRVTCSGPFTPSMRSDVVRISASCSDTQRGEGEGQETGSGSGEGTLKLKDGKTARFVFGEAAKAP